MSVCQTQHLCKSCYHAVTSSKLIGGTYAFEGLECFELNKDVTPLPDRYDILECDSYTPKKQKGV